MIQSANVGIGIVGKEGLQASLAADYSLSQFHHLAKLLLVGFIYFSHLVSSKNRFLREFFS